MLETIRAGGTFNGCVLQLIGSNFVFRNTGERPVDARETRDIIDNTYRSAVVCGLRVPGCHGATVGSTELLVFAGPSKQSRLHSTF